MLNVQLCRRSRLSPRFRSPWSHHDCIRKCSSAMKFLNWPSSWLPFQLFGIKSLILYGLAVSAGPAESFCMTLEMLLSASSLPLIAVCISSRTRCNESAVSCLICCCNVIRSAVVATPACYSATAAAAADLEGLQVTPFAMALNSAALP